MDAASPRVHQFQKSHSCPAGRTAGRRLEDREGAKRFGDESITVAACNLCALDPPERTSCGHFFCWQCMVQVLQGEGKPCPVCAAMLSSEMHVAPFALDNGALILWLPTAEDLKQNYCMLDWIRENCTPKVPEEALSVSENRDVVVSGPNQSSPALYRNLYLTSRIEEMQRRVRRAQQSSWVRFLRPWKSNKQVS